MKFYYLLALLFCSLSIFAQSPKIESSPMTNEQLMKYLNLKGGNWEFKFEEDLYYCIRTYEIDDDKQTIPEYKEFWGSEKVKKFDLLFTWQQNEKTEKDDNGNTLASYHEYEVDYFITRHPEPIVKTSPDGSSSHSISSGFGTNANHQTFRRWKQQYPAGWSTDYISPGTNDIEIGTEATLLKIAEKESKRLLHYTIEFTRENPTIKYKDALKVDSTYEQEKQEFTFTITNTSDNDLDFIAHPFNKLSQSIHVGFKDVCSFINPYDNKWLKQSSFKEITFKAGESKKFALPLSMIKDLKLEAEKMANYKRFKKQISPPSILDFNLRLTLYRLGENNLPVHAISFHPEKTLLSISYENLLKQLP